MGVLSVTPPAAAAPTGPDTVGEAALACIARWGIGKTTLDDIAREAGISRATLYRRFPGGKESVLQHVVLGELQRFQVEVGDLLGRCADLEDLVTTGVGAALRFLAGHEGLAAVVRFEPELLLPICAFHRAAPALDAISAYVGPWLEPHIGTSADDGARYLARVVLSYAVNPSPYVDPFDPGSMRRLARTHLLPTIRSLPEEQR